MFISGTYSPNVKIDVTDYIETKITALREHKSQIADMEAMAERQRANHDPEFIAADARFTESFRVITFDR